MGEGRARFALLLLSPSRLFLLSNAVWLSLLLLLVWYVSDFGIVLMFWDLSRGIQGVFGERCGTEMVTVV